MLNEIPLLSVLWSRTGKQGGEEKHSHEEHVLKLKWYKGRTTGFSLHAPQAA